MLERENVVSISWREQLIEEKIYFLYKNHQKIVDSYFEKDAIKLRKMADKILVKLKFHDVDKEDFYSLSNEVFVDVLRRYDKSENFDGFLYSCLTNKFKTEMTKRNRYKRKADRDSISIDAPIEGEDGIFTLADIIASKLTVEGEVFGEEDGYSREMHKYLSKLSSLQKQVLYFLSIGFMPNEILKELHINQKMYEDCYNAIHSYRNTSILM